MGRGILLWCWVYPSDNHPTRSDLALTSSRRRTGTVSGQCRDEAADPSAGCVRYGASG